MEVKSQWLIMSVQPRAPSKSSDALECGGEGGLNLLSRSCLSFPGGSNYRVAYWVKRFIWGISFLLNLLG